MQTSCELSALEARTAAVDAELAELVSAAHADARAAVPAIAACGADLTGITRGLTDLNDSLDRSAELVERIGGNVKRLHTVQVCTHPPAPPPDAPALSLCAPQGSVHATMGLLDKMLEIDRGVAAARSALSQTDFGQAVEHACRLRASVVAAADALDSPTKERIDQVQAEVRQAVLAQLEGALAGVDAARAGRFCQLRALLGEVDASVAQYASFCERQLQAAVRPVEKDLEGDARGAVAAQLGRVLQRAAALMAAAKGLLDTQAGGAAARSQLVDRVLACSIELGSPLTAQYSAAAGLDSLVRVCFAHCCSLARAPLFTRCLSCGRTHGGGWSSSRCRASSPPSHPTPRRRRSVASRCSRLVPSRTIHSLAATCRRMHARSRTNRARCATRRRRSPACFAVRCSTTATWRRGARPAPAARRFGAAMGSPSWRAGSSSSRRSIRGRAC